MADDKEKAEVKQVRRAVRGADGVTRWADDPNLVPPKSEPEHEGITSADLREKKSSD